MLSGSLSRVQILQPTKAGKKLMTGLDLAFFGFILIYFKISVPVYGLPLDFFTTLLGYILIGGAASRLTRLQVNPSYNWLMAYVNVASFAGLVITYFSLMDNLNGLLLRDLNTLVAFTIWVAFVLAMVVLCRVVDLAKVQRNWLVTLGLVFAINALPTLVNFVQSVWLIGGSNLKFNLSDFSESSSGWFLLGLLFLVFALPIFFMGWAIGKTRVALKTSENWQVLTELQTFWDKPRPFSNRLRALFLTLPAVGFLALLTGLPTLLSSAAVDTTLSLKVGKNYEPRSMTVDKTTGDIIVVTSSSIERYNAAGQLLREDEVSGYRTWFSSVTTDRQGFTYVVDRLNQTVLQYDANGQLVSNWRPDEKANSKSNEFSSPEGIISDEQGNIYVANLNRINKYNSNGQLLLNFQPINGATSSIFSPLPSNALLTPNFTGLAIDKQGNIYAADYVNSRIFKFDEQGNLVKTWGERGERRGQFKMAFAIAVDSKGFVYVADRHNHRIQVFDSEGNFVKMWGSEGSATGQFVQPIGLAIDSADNVYVLDISHFLGDKKGNLQKFSLKN